MAEITLSGNPVTTAGSLPAEGTTAPDFELVGADLAAVTREAFAGRRLVLNIFPSIDTGTCALSVRTFNQRAAALKDAAVLCISRDLPFAQERFCGAEGIENVTVASDFRGSFGEDYGVTMTDGPLRGLLSRAVVVLDADGTVLHSQQVPEIRDEPDYDAALAVLD